jgi:serine/threonine protein kinase
MKNNHIKIGDFGFAISIEDIKTCHNVGSPHYMSP